MLNSSRDVANVESIKINRFISEFLMKLFTNSCTRTCYVTSISLRQITALLNRPISTFLIRNSTMTGDLCEDNGSSRLHKGIYQLLAISAFQIISLRPALIKDNIATWNWLKNKITMNNFPLSVLYIDFPCTREIQVKAIKELKLMLIHCSSFIQIFFPCIVRFQFTL